MIDTLVHFTIGALVGGFFGGLFLFEFLPHTTLLEISLAAMAFCILAPALGLGLISAILGSKGARKATESYFDWIRSWYRRR